MTRIADLIHDWNVGDGTFRPARQLQFDDETLRDGLQSPGVSDPTLAAKIDLVERMDRLGIHTANLGLPGAGGRPREDILALAQHIAKNKLRIGANVACRTVVSDIEPVVEMTQRAGMPIEVCAFIGSSYIRQYAEDWTLERMLQNTREALSFARKHNLPVMYVTEDTTRARPETVKALYSEAIELGARRLCVCDTVGHATPQGARAVVAFVRDLADRHDKTLGVDWHGHRDRDLGIANCLAAIEAGADRVHGTALGVGERAGNAPMDLLLVNCRLLGWIDNDLSTLPQYVAAAAKALQVEIPHNYPVLGTDAFETGTGVHAAAVIKAFKKGDTELADAVYSGVPAGMVGLQQKIAVGPMAGKSNAAFVLERLGIEPTEERVQRVLAAGKSSKRLLTDDEVRAAAGSLRRRASSSRKRKPIQGRGNGRMDQVLDMSVVEELLSFADDGDPELLLDLIQMFLDDGPSKVAAVTEGLAKGDLEKAERAAHSLKGSSGNLGAKLLQNACEDMQLATRYHKLEESRRLAPVLSQRFAEAEAALRKLLATYKA